MLKMLNSDGVETDLPAHWNADLALANYTALLLDDLIEHSHIVLPIGIERVSWVLHEYAENAVGLLPDDFAAEAQAAIVWVSRNLTSLWS